MNIFEFYSGILIYKNIYKINTDFSGCSLFFLWKFEISGIALLFAEEIDEREFFLVLESIH
jgi:hypothetical protein